MDGFSASVVSAKDETDISVLVHTPERELMYVFNAQEELCKTFLDVGEISIVIYPDGNRVDLAPVQRKTA
jgi:hypothetical protein